ncbi:FGGY-family carbohydrate kinase [Domibacillus sp. DTU_2020_1001157_1_SI_ALB_TIR_016]|uniref:xylulokinase n=1 Tax=Domibacillus sp. DTU_2020_1001157_1_SI_ALB_TIR_016 TaxID=3077789 RepID=UPI0028E3D06B|nr:FGGY-family carbohydrate kinase [Domibacillus sp. DTU_2020_1001157_1_SI_ALB_TIR_016]WNS82473.1 FGGY-family carbohydrate kinase [Domibacillus sp. DTU_2020_1001157_1_SI_ALB_TIR_016]
MNKLDLIKADIASSRTALGIEFGSTRIKAVLIDSNHSSIASGSYEWENRLEEGIWTYSLDDIWKGLQTSYQEMANEVKEKYGVILQKVGAIGFSAMMHGYMAFNKDGELLVPFRTWRNSITEQAEKELTALFNYNIPQRWSIAHLYQAIINGEEHVENIDFFTTLAGYIHWKLTGKKVLGAGDASGMFPIDVETKDYDTRMIQAFDDLIMEKNYPWKLKEILPQTMQAGDEAGQLSEDGAKLLDVSGSLQAGIPLCPPEGDAGTGMVATNSVAQRTGNVSAGTSVFAMIVLEKELKKVYPEIDLVTTPSGSLVGMVHANNCSSDINAWMKLFEEFSEALGYQVNKDKLFEVLFNRALEGDKDCGGLLSYGYYSGENITGMREGRPLFVRSPESNFNLANFMRVHLFSALGTLKIGMDILLHEENIGIDKILGHGGLFKTKGVGQKIMAAAMNAPVSVMETAGEGGAWGIALLASFTANKEENESLEEYLDKKVFGDNVGVEVEADEEDVEGFEAFMDRYKQGLAIEQAAIDHLLIQKKVEQLV